MKILMTPHFCEIGRHFVHYLCFSGHHILPDGHFPIDWAHLRRKKKELKHYGTGETTCNGFPLRMGVSDVSGSFGVGPDVIHEGYIVINASQGSFK